ncbi:MAG: 2Fe-2S iron-sulfur cluster-binding protein [Beijerinckiaceae bacterium]
MNIEDHPTVKHLRARSVDGAGGESHRRIEADWLRQLALDCGADDVGLVEIDRPALDSQRDELLHHYPWTKTLLSFVVRMNREPVRSPARSVANLEFHHSGELVNEVGRRVVRRLEAMGIRAVSPSMGFPMEMYQFPSAIWVVSHKPIAVAAGLGHMGIHRNVIHPKFGNFILLGTVLVDAETAEHNAPIDYNPCLECRLCVAACPVGAIAPDGGFNFAACLTHNYREFMGGFTDWVEQIADSKDAFDYRSRASEPETASMWQSLSHGANYKSAYCMAVCPAGEDVIGPYLRDRARHIQEVVKPLQEKPEPVYVIKGSDAETYARKKWKNKTVKPVGNGLHPRRIEGMLQFLPFVFQPNQSRDLHATYHFEFTGDEQRKATVVIRDATIRVYDGHVGSPDLRVTADSQTWLGFLAKEHSLVWAFLRGKIRVSGSPKLLLAFGRCFPSAGVRHQPTPIRPNRSRLRPDPIPYRRNDPATGKIRWSGVLELAEIIEVTHNVKTFRLINPAGGKIPFAFLPGQFLTLAVEPSGIPAKRSYTIASSPACRDWIEITVKREAQGLVSRWLHDAVRPGEALEVLAPNGTFTFNGNEEESVVLIGGGVGITPLMSVTRFLTERCWPGDIHLILGFRNPGDYLFREEIATLQSRNSRLQVAVTMSDPKDEDWHGPRGHIDQAFLASAIPNIATKRVHLCGPPAMMEAVTGALIGLGMPPRLIKKEAFGTITRDPASKTRAVGRIIGRVIFQMSQVSAQISEAETILDTADKANVYIDNACRSGTCGACRIKLLSGKVHMPVEDSLTEEEKSRGYILACQAQAESDVVVES